MIINFENIKEVEKYKEPLVPGVEKLFIYEKIDINTPYVIAVKCGMSIETDKNVVTVLDVQNRETPNIVIDLESTGSVSNLSNELVLLTQMIPKSILVVITNTTGLALINNLRHSMISSNLLYSVENGFLKFGYTNKMSSRAYILDMFESVMTTENIFTTKSTAGELHDIIMKKDINSVMTTDNILTILCALVAITESTKLDEFGLTLSDNFLKRGELDYAE